MYHIASCSSDLRQSVSSALSALLLGTVYSTKSFQLSICVVRHGGIRMVCFGKAFYIRHSPLANDLGIRQSRWISLGETVQRTAFKMLDATAYPGGLISSTSGRHKLYYYTFSPDIFHGRHKDYQPSPTLSTFSTVFVKSDFHHWHSLDFAFCQQVQRELKQSQRLQQIGRAHV